MLNSLSSSKLSRRLAQAFLRGGDGGRIHSSFRIGLLAVALTVAFLSLAFGIYDSYAQKLETIALSVYPHLIVIDHGTEAQESAAEKVSDGDFSQRICAGETFLGGHLEMTQEIAAQSKAKLAATPVSRVEPLRAAVKTLDPAASVAPIIFDEVDLRLQLEAEGAPTVSRRIRVLGIDPTASRLVPEVDRFVDPSWIARLREAPEAMVISQSLAEAFHLAQPFEEIGAMAEDAAGTRHGLMVVGSFSLGFHSLAENMVVTSLEGAQRLLNMPGEASYFGVSLEDPYTAAPLREALRRPLASHQLGASDWTSIAGGDFANIRLFRWILVLTLGLCLVITALGIRNTLAIVTVERRRQIGILRAIGLRNGEIRHTFLWIALGISGLGALLGLPLGVLGSLVFGRWLDTALAELLPIHGISVGVHPFSLMLIVVLVLVAAVITGLVAVRSALVLEPTQCLASE